MATKVEILALAGRRSFEMWSDVRASDADSTRTGSGAEQTFATVGERQPTETSDTRLHMRPGTIATFPEHMHFELIQRSLL